jgi:probable DNA metabolism protein
MTTIIYDGTWSGMLTLIFEVFEYKLAVTNIYRKGTSVQPGLFGSTKTIITEKTKALRVWKGLAKKVTNVALSDLYKVFLSEQPQIEVTLCSVITFYFSKINKPDLNYGRDDVLKVKQVAKAVDRERHRMKAFVRFKRLKDDLYFSMIEPDFNVVPLIRQHFHDRYADQKWLIYDIKRNYGIYYDLTEVLEIELDFSNDDCSTNITLEHTEESLYNDLWQRYFRHVNIKERKNMKLHIQHVPKRYWKHLIEKIPVL